LATVAFVAALSATSASSAFAQEIPFTRTRLDNGLTVILHEDHRLPLVSVNLWYYVGAKDEPPKRSGFAHLFEHLMFMGTEKVPTGEFDTRMERRGGSNNATTSSDRTNYFETGPSDLLDLFLFLEADRMAGLGKAMTLEKLDVQRGVVRNERRQNYENRPYGGAQLVIPKAMYPDGHPYREPTIGSHEDLESASVEDVVSFFDQFYFAGNASLVIAGDFDSNEALKLVDKHFGKLPKRPALVRPKVEPAKLEDTVQREVFDAVRLPLLTLVWHSPAFYKAGDAEMDILADVLGGGKSSRLYRKLVYEKELAQSVDVYQYSRLLGGEFRIEVYARPGASNDENRAKLAEIEKLVDEEIAKLQAEGPTKREVDRARNKMETGFWTNLESLARKADLLNGYQFYFDDPGAVAKDRERFEKVDAASVKRYSTVLDAKKRLVLSVLPKEKSEEEAK